MSGLLTLSLNPKFLGLGRGGAKPFLDETLSSLLKFILWLKSNVNSDMRVGAILQWLSLHSELLSFSLALRKAMPEFPSKSSITRWDISCISFVATSI